jgi:hypothetical protein
MDKDISYFAALKQKCENEIEDERKAGADRKETIPVEFKRVFPLAI